MMTSVRRGVRRLLGRLTGAITEDRPAGELVEVLDALSALAVVERAVAHGRVRVGTPALQEWSARDGVNAFAESTAELFAGDAAGAVALGTALSLSGLRASVLLDAFASDAQRQLALASARHVPLVTIIAARRAQGAGRVPTDPASLCLVAGTVQEAVDLVLVGRRAAEAALVPVVLSLDAHAAASLQDVRLPSADLLRRLLGRASDDVQTPTEAQRALFSDERRRDPRWYDLDRPAMIGGGAGGAAAGVVDAGRHAWFLRHAGEHLEDACAAHSALSGRPGGALREHLVADAQVVLVGAGAVVDVLCAVADGLRKSERLRVGVVGIRSLHPLPRARLGALLEGRRAVGVVDGVDPGLGDAPLARELRALTGGDRLFSAVTGMAGAPLRAADLAAWCRRLFDRAPRLVHLGAAFTSTSTAWPTQEAERSALRRAYPDLEERGSREPATLDVRPDKALTLALATPAGGAGSELAVDVARVWRAACGGCIRGRSALIDVVTRGEEGCRDPGDDVPVDVGVIPTGSSVASMSAVIAALAPGARLLLEGADAGAAWRALPERSREEVRRGGAAVVHIDPSPANDVEERHELRVGAALAALALAGAALPPLRKLLALRKAAWSPRDDEERERLTTALRTGLEGVHALEVGELAEAAAQDGPRGAMRVPEAARRLATARGEGPPVLSLPYFWSHVGGPHAEAAPEDLVDGPAVASGVVPALSSLLRTAPAGASTALPRLRADACTGCGRCWTLCPEGALSPVVIGPRALLEAGIGLAKQDGAEVEPLRPLVSKLAPRANAALLRADAAPTSTRTWLEPSFAELVSKAKLPADRATAVEQAFAAVMDVIGPLPVTRTAALFDEAEREGAGCGEVLSLVLDPDGCKACGACAAACDAEALSLAPVDPEELELERRRWQLWEALPDTSGATVARAQRHDDMGLLAGALLSRHCLSALAGRDDTEPGSGSRTAIRLTLASAEETRQRVVQRQLTALAQLIDDVKQGIAGTLRQALPGADLEALAQALRAFDADTAPLSSLLHEVEQGAAEGTASVVEIGRLGPLTTTARELEAECSRLATGPMGLGRSRLGVVLCGDRLMEGLATFPHNSFSAPVVVATAAEALAVARGLAEGHAREAVASARLARRARLQLKSAAEAELAEDALARLSFEDLDHDEREACAPVLVIAASGALDERSLAPLVAARLPVKLLLLADADGGERGPLSLLALARGAAFVSQSSLAAAPHLGESLRAAFQSDSVAIVQVYVPSPRWHGTLTEALFEQAELALRSRAYPLFRFDPSRDGVLGTRLDLEGNPDAAAPWASDERGPLTPLHWALSQPRFASCFAALDDEAPGATAAERYLQLPAPERSGKTAYVVEPGEEATRLAPSKELLADADRRLADWRTLQELAGVVTPFTAAVRAEAERDVAASHARHVAALHEEHAAALEGLRDAHAADLTAKVQQRLMVIAGYAAPGGDARGRPS